MEALSSSTRRRFSSLSTSTSEARAPRTQSEKERVPFLGIAQARGFLLQSPAWIALCFRFLKIARGCKGRKRSREGMEGGWPNRMLAMFFLLTPLALSDPPPRRAQIFDAPPANASLVLLPLDSLPTGHHKSFLMLDLREEKSKQETGRERSSRRQKGEREGQHLFFFSSAPRAANQVSHLLLSPSPSLSLSLHAAIYSPQRCAPRGKGPCRASSGGTGAPWRWPPRRRRARARRCRRRRAPRLARQNAPMMKPKPLFLNSRVKQRRCGPENSNQMVRIES